VPFLRIVIPTGGGWFYRRSEGTCGSRAREGIVVCDKTQILPPAEAVVRMTIRGWQFQDGDSRITISDGDLFPGCQFVAMGIYSLSALRHAPSAVDTAS
jgi:hypothetical protein